RGRGVRGRAGAEECREEAVGQEGVGQEGVDDEGPCEEVHHHAGDGQEGARGAPEHDEEGRGDEDDRGEEVHRGDEVHRQEGLCQEEHGEAGPGCLSRWTSGRPTSRPGPRTPGWTLRCRTWLRPRTPAGPTPSASRWPRTWTPCWRRGRTRT